MSSNCSLSFIEKIDIKNIRPSNYSSREELEPLDGLMLSIVEHGLLQPVVVRPKGEAYEVIAGNRRLEACRRVGRRKIECNIVEVDDKEAQEMAIVENIQRNSLNPIEEAKSFKSYIDSNGYGGASELAKKIGKSPSYISRRLSLLSLSKEAQEQLLRQRKSTSIVEELLTVDEGNRNQLWTLAMQTNIRRSELRRVIKFLKNSDDISIESKYSRLEEEHQKLIDNVFSKVIFSLRLCLNRVDDIIDNLDGDEWLLREVMMEQRLYIHEQIDKLLSLKKKKMISFT